MIRTLRMDFRRLFRTRSYYISILIALAFLAILGGAAYYVTGLAQQMAQTEVDLSTISNPTVLDMARQQMNIGFFASFFLSHNSLLHLILVLFAAGYIAKDHQSGYLKNLFCIPQLRLKWLFSKLIVLLVASLLYYLVFLLGCALVVLLYGNTLSPDFADLARYFGLHLSVDMALFALICLITALLQTKTAAVILALVLSFNLQGILYLLIDSIGFLPVKLGSYGMMGLAGKLQLEGSIMSFVSKTGGTTTAQMLPVSLTLFVLSLFAGIFAIHRVDYRA